MIKQEVVLQLQRILDQSESSADKLQLEQQEFQAKAEEFVYEMRLLHDEINRVEPINLPDSRAQKFHYAKVKLRQSLNALLESIKV